MSSHSLLRGVRGRVERSNRTLVSISSFFFQNWVEIVKIKRRLHLKIQYYNILAPLNMKIPYFLTIFCCQNSWKFVNTILLLRLNMKMFTFWRFFGLKVAENLVLQHFIFPEYEIQYFLMIFWCQNSWKFGITTF